MTDLASLATDFLANFRTVRIRPPERVEVPPGDWWAMIKARRSAHRAAHAYRDRLCQGLAEHGYHRVLDRMEPDPAGGWRLHIFAADEAALTLLDELTEGACGRGDPVSFNPEKKSSCQRVCGICSKMTPIRESAPRTLSCQN